MAMENSEIRKDLYQKCSCYLKKLCIDITDRSVGSEGNRIATQFFEKELLRLGWETEKLEFEAIDWIDGGAELTVADKKFEVFAGPYSLGCSVEAQLVGASTIEGLIKLDCKGKILFLYGDVAKEQLMPKNFIFYNPDEHKRIIAQLEKCGCRAIICATGRNSALAGGKYPFPLIEDGDFDIPSVYMTDKEGKKLLPKVGKKVKLFSGSRRIPGKGYNVIGKKDAESTKRIVITAHIDAKKGTPGAIDNASGVAILLLIAQLLKNYSGKNKIEIVAFNGEDYFAVPGQMCYIRRNRNAFDNVILNINIDGAGYKVGKSAFSFYNLPEHLHKKAVEVMEKYPGIVEGIQWPQGDHSIFVQYGRPAAAVSSKWFTENINSQTITHTPEDKFEIIDCNKVVELAEAISELVGKV